LSTIFEYGNQWERGNRIWIPDQFEYDRTKYTPFRIWSFYKTKKIYTLQNKFVSKKKYRFLKITHGYNENFTNALFIYFYFIIVKSFSFFSHHLFLSLSNNLTFHYFSYLFLLHSFIFFHILFFFFHYNPTLC